MKVLVSAATAHGATTDVAMAIARVLQTRGIDTDERPPEAVSDVTEYDAVVLGSAVHDGLWLASATALVDRCAVDLAGRPVWLFSAGWVGHPAAAEAPDVVALESRTAAVEHRLFARPLGERDEDWAQITQWAWKIADHLLAGAVH